MPRRASFASSAAAEGATELAAAETTPIPELRTNDSGGVLVSSDEILRMIDAGACYPLRPKQ